MSRGCCLMGNAVVALCFDVHDNSHIQILFSICLERAIRIYCSVCITCLDSNVWKGCSLSDITLSTNCMSTNIITNNYIQNVFLSRRFLAARPGLIVSVVPFRHTSTPLTYQVQIVKSVPVVHLKDLFLFGTSVATSVPSWLERKSEEGNLLFCYKLHSATSFRTDKVKWWLNYRTLSKEKLVFLCLNMLHCIIIIIIIISAAVSLFFISIE